MYWVNARPATGAEGSHPRVFPRPKVEVIVTNGPAVAALKQATSVIPIVFALAPDPVGGALVESLARPGGKACR